MENEVFLREKLLEYEELFWLAARDVIIFLEGDLGEWKASVFCSDTFCLACADTEALPPGRVHEVKAVYEAYGWPGVTAWVAMERGQEPLKKHRTGEYLTAKDFLIYQREALPD